MINFSGKHFGYLNLKRLILSLIFFLKKVEGNKYKLKVLGWVSMLQKNLSYLTLAGPD